MKVLSLFSGIGAFEKALKNLDIPFELVGFSEIDKYAVKSYCAIHSVSESMNFGDITKIDEKALPKDIDLITYGFPCQDISLAGKQKGLFNDDGSQTRSGLFFEALRIIEETQPKIAIAENVKNLVSKKFNAQFQLVLASLEAAGYNNYYQVLNAKDYGIPQNRERVFIVSIRKDIDTGTFNFPEPFPLELRLKDILEDTVDEKFYLKKRGVEYVYRHEGVRTQLCTENSDTTKCAITANGNANWTGNFIKEPEVNQIGNCCPTKTRDNPNQGRIYDTEGLAPCLNQMGGGNRQPFILTVKKIGNIYPSGGQNGNVYDSGGLSPTILSGETNTKGNGGIGSSNAPKVLNDRRIRKLTPKECFRLMGFSDEDFAKAEAVNSSTQLYKQAGNSIVVDVIAHIFTHIPK